jgi:hypothetical protein
MEKNEISPAKLAILSEWDVWAKKYPPKAMGSNGMLFFEYLQQKRPDLLLDFKSSGDKWTIVHTWLLTARKVKR